MINVPLYQQVIEIPVGVTRSGLRCILLLMRNELVIIATSKFQVKGCFPRLNVPVFIKILIHMHVVKVEPCRQAKDATTSFV